jgi:hypothetical protein
MISNTEINFPNIIITSIGIRNSFGLDFQIFPRNNSTGISDESFLLDELTIKEDMFSEAIFGSISFFDSSYIVDQLNLTSSLDSVYFKLNAFDTNHEYRILDVNVASDLASKQVHGPVGTVNKVTIRFSSDSFINKNFDTLFDSNYIGKISKGSGSESGTSSIPPGFDQAEYQTHEAKMQGFVQHLMEKYNSTIGIAGQKPLNADDTHNDIWVKTENFFYPLFKIGNNLRISQLMNYVCEYACYKKNPKAVNFFFWEDTQKWNFKCIESLLSDETNFKGTYNLAGDRGQSENYSDTIVAMEVISDTSPLKLYDGGAAFSEYIRVKPDWGNPYRGFVDSSNGLLREQVTYNYKDDTGTNIAEGGWKRIAPFSPFTDFILNKYKTKQDYGTVRISDLNYGFYSNTYNTKNIPWWNYYDFSSPHGYLGDKMALPEANGGYDIHNKQDLFNKYPGSKEVSRIDSEYWQAQYDFSELPGAFLRTIYKDIKWALTDARTKYAEAKATKTLWDVYRNVICCDSASSSNGSFFAILTSAEEVTVGPPGGVYRYDWRQIELWPRSEVDKISDTSYEIIESKNIPYHFVFISSKKHAKGSDAYNLNELLNSYIPTSKEKGNKTLTMGPGISVPTNTMSYKDREDTTSYPKHFSMMPIGEYLVSEKGSCDPSRYYSGQIVQLQAVSPDSMSNIKGFTTGSNKQKSKIYVFDAQNAHDGICGKCSGD